MPEIETSNSVKSTNRKDKDNASNECGTSKHTQAKTSFQKGTSTYAQAKIKHHSPSTKTTSMPIINLNRWSIKIDEELKSRITNNRWSTQIDDELKSMITSNRWST